MKSIKIVLLLMILFISHFLSAQSSKQKIWINTSRGNLLKGVLISTTDSSLTGKFSEQNQNSKAVLNESYLNITDIEIHKKGGLLKGILIGGAIGISPVLVGSLFGPSIGQGAAYVSIIAFPVGIITGAILGGTSKKKFFIGGDQSKFYTFHKRMKY